MSETVHKPRTKAIEGKSRSEREVILVRDATIVWRGYVLGAGHDGGGTAQDYLNEAWRRALQDGAVATEDAGAIQFRFSAL